MGEVEIKDTKAKKAMEWARGKYTQWKKERAENRAVEREAYLKGRRRGVEERVYHEARGYKSRTQIMAERPPRYADGRGYGRPYRERYPRYAQRGYQQQYQEQPQRPPNVLDNVLGYESRILGRRRK